MQPRQQKLNDGRPFMLKLSLADLDGTPIAPEPYALALRRGVLRTLRRGSVPMIFWPDQCEVQAVEEQLRLRKRLAETFYYSRQCVLIELVQREPLYEQPVGREPRTHAL